LIASIQVILQGTSDDELTDDTEWLDFEFRVKPGNINRYENLNNLSKLLLGLSLLLRLSDVEHRDGFPLIIFGLTG
jgi:hypothetical protein